jgi:hypothetical protein
MSVILLALVVLAALLIIASGIWVGIALVRALTLPRRAESPAPSRREDAPT